MIGDMTWTTPAEAKAYAEGRAEGIREAMAMISKHCGEYPRSGRARFALERLDADLAALLAAPPPPAATCTRGADCYIEWCPVHAPKPAAEKK